MTTDAPKLTGTQKWLVALTIFVVLGYAWISARLMEPRLLLPNTIDQAVWFEAGKLRSMRTLSQMGPSHFREWTRVFAQAKNLAHESAILGKFESPVQLIINTENRSVYAVSDQRIEIGVDIAARDGQLLKALIKAWLLQHAAPSIRASQLRIEVVSDVILGASKGSFSLESSDGSFLEAPPILNWLRFASSFARSCGERWLPIELSQFCGSSERLNPLTLRPLLTAMVLESFRSVPPLERLAAIRDWIDTLKIEPKVKLKSPNSLLDWRGWLRAEALTFLTLEPSRIEPILEKAGLGEDASLQVDFVLKMEDWQTKSDVDTKRLLAVVEDQANQFKLNPAGLEVKSEDLPFISSPISVRSGCSGETVRETLAEPIKSRQVLYLPCPKRSVVFVGMAQGGVQMFMRENPQVAFVQFNRSALERAYGMNLLGGSTSLGRALDGRKLSPLLGLEQAEWNTRNRAFHVLGAVETIGWFRLQSESPTLRLVR